MIQQHLESVQSLFAKPQLGASSVCGKCKLLRLKWDKVDDTLHVSLSSQPATLTKRGILADLAKVSDPLELVSPAMLEGKQIYQEASEMRLSWDAPQTEGIAKRWLQWEKNAPDDVYFPRSLVQYQEPIDNIKLHAFGNASIHGVCAAVYTVVTQASGATQGLISNDSSFGARVRPHGSQLVNKCAGCVRRLQNDEGYTVLARQHCSPTLGTLR